MMTDPIADLLTRIRNAQTVRHPQVSIPHSCLKESILKVLKQEGLIQEVECVGQNSRKQLVVQLKYTHSGEGVIEELQRVSTPGRRVYLGYTELKPIRNGLGFSILSTSRGIVTDSMARQQKLGGEVLIRVW